MPPYCVYHGVYMPPYLPQGVHTRLPTYHRVYIPASPYVPQGVLLASPYVPQGVLLASQDSHEAHTSLSGQS